MNETSNQNTDTNIIDTVNLIKAKKEHPIAKDAARLFIPLFTGVITSVFTSIAVNKAIEKKEKKRQFIK